MQLGGDINITLYQFGYVNLTDISQGHTRRNNPRPMGLEQHLKQQNI
jgi:hypothetical protein